MEEHKGPREVSSRYLERNHEQTQVRVGVQVAPHVNHKSQHGKAHDGQREKVCGNEHEEGGKEQHEDKVGTPATERILLQLCTVL